VTHAMLCLVHNNPPTEEARRRGGPCLVYCKKGMSRSGAVVVAYLMQAQVNF
jgi:protein-tyrosine phosphatase